MRKVSAIPILAAVIMAAMVALACAGPAFVVRLEDGRPLRIWDGDQLEEYALYSESHSLNDVVNISLQCQQYEDSDYEFIDACRSVPDDLSIWVVEVKGDSRVRSFDFGQSLHFRLKWDSDSVHLRDNNAGNLVIKDISEMIITLKKEAP